MKQRVITAIILVLIIVPTLIFGGLPWQILISLIGLGAIFEWQRMNQRKLTDFDTILAMICVFAMIHSQILFSKISFFNNLIQLAFALMILLLSATIWTDSYDVQDAGYTFIGALYIGLGTMSALVTRQMSLYLLIYLVIVITMTDTWAYFVGRAFGKNKLAPTISPNKTIEGSVGGVVLATLISMIFAYFYELPEITIPIVLMSIMLSIVGQLGDLILSGVKRHFKVKDTGTLLPGHGGLLDRFDSLLFGLSVLWIFGL